MATMLSVIHLSPQAAFPTPDPGQKKFNSRPVVPTIFRDEPFREYVEGLFHCWDRSYSSTSMFKCRSAMA
jgi:hypothetical protein